MKKKLCVFFIFLFSIIAVNAQGDDCCDEANNLLTNGNFNAATCGGNAFQNGCVPNWVREDGSPSLFGFGANPNAWMWSYGGGGEAISAGMNFQAGITYYICFRIRTDDRNTGDPNVANNATVNVVATNNAGNVTASPNGEIIFQDTMGSYLNTWTTINVQFTPTVNYAQLWVFPFMQQPSNGVSQSEMNIDDIIITKKEVHTSCVDLACGEVFDVNALNFSDFCGGEVISIEDLANGVSYPASAPITFNQSTVVKLTYDCCELFLCVNVAEQGEVEVQTKEVCPDKDGMIRMEACGNGSGSYTYILNGLAESSTQSSRTVPYVPGGEYSVTYTSDSGCTICKVVYTVIQPTVTTAYALWCREMTRLDLSTIIDPDCIGSDDSFTLVNNATGDTYNSLVLNDPSGGFDLFSQGGNGDLLCLTYTSYDGDCIRCIVKITVRFYEGDCDDKLEPIYCDDRDSSLKTTPVQINTNENSSGMVSNFVIHPNPSDGNYKIVTSNFSKVSNEKTYKISVTDISGKSILTIEAIPLDTPYNLDISKYTSGIYFLTLQVGKKTEVKKLIKK